MGETSVKVFLATKMRCAVVSALISIACLSQGFAVLRPLVPVKPEPTLNSEPIIIEDDSAVGLQENTCYIAGVRHRSQYLDAALSLRDGAVSLWQRFRDGTRGAA
jgi:hypothetical protein